MRDNNFELTEQGLERLCIAIQNGVSIENAIALAGITLLTYYKYLSQIEWIINNDPRAQMIPQNKIEFLMNLSEHMQIAYATGEQEYVAVIDKAAKKDGDWRAAKYMLENRFGWSVDGSQTSKKIQRFLEGELDPVDLSEEELKGLTSGIANNDGPD